MNSIDYLLSRQRKLDCCTHNRNNSTLASSVFPSNFHQNCSNYLSFVDGKFVVKLVDDNHNCRTVAAAVAAVVDSNNDAFEPASSEAAYAEEALMGLEVEYAYFVVYVTRRNLAILRMWDRLFQLEILASSWPKACTRTSHYWASFSWDDIEAANVTELVEFEGDDQHVDKVEECTVEDAVLGVVDIKRPRWEYHYCF